MRRFRVIVIYDFLTEMDRDTVETVFYDVLMRGIRTPDLPKPHEIKIYYTGK